MNHWSTLHTSNWKTETGYNVKLMNEWLTLFQSWKGPEILLVKSLILQWKFLRPRKMKRLARDHTDNETHQWECGTQTSDFQDAVCCLLSTPGKRHIFCFLSGNAIPCPFDSVPTFSFSLYFAIYFNWFWPFISFILFPLCTTGKTEKINLTCRRQGFSRNWKRVWISAEVKGQL